MIDPETWPARADRLRVELVEAGKLTDDRLQAAVLAVPRHVFVPSFYEQNGSPQWERRSREDTPEEWWSAVYANRPLTTQVGQLDPDDNNLLPTSSSAPSVMVRMLEALRLDGGHRVLEIGTGTGYNAALLSHRLGAEHVYSVDVDPTLVEAARDHLAELGFTPTLRVTDGARGLPGHAPFDRIIGTCAVDRVPWAWVEQTVPGGLVLVDLKVLAGIGAGNLVRLERFQDRLEGRFDLGGYATFMHMRNAEAAPIVAPSMDRDAGEARHTTTEADVPHQVWGSYVTWFLLHLAPGAQRVTFGSVTDEETGKPGAALYVTADGSWCEVEPGEPGSSRAVRSGGPRDLWADIVAARELWATEGRPDWDRFGLTVTREDQWVWLDRPDGVHRWRL
ncbi:protein-L-isoaspartate carboxylmethyltransferase [Amycolatopsis antarctica]|uniref:Protein-L-isoaspartate O-methyltransferase n=1 Tax=Amycolatopsis antarctica TaxID=1854586 RepID=A0A263CZ75_9PSEU|nr:methyltransferase domain-containing protein [Amycolatopsis antarctica]OZM71269.1 protein-L-isoaspartate carboxylmethyltransferase [Amycolatopsis antarctica]